MRTDTRGTLTIGGATFDLDVTLDLDELNGTVNCLAIEGWEITPVLDDDQLKEITDELGLTNHAG